MTYHGSWTHVETAQAARDAIQDGKAVVCAVDVALASGVNRARVAAVLCHKPNVTAVNTAIAESIAKLRAAGGPQHPCLGYVDDLDADVNGIDQRAWIGRNCYLRVSDHKLGPVVGEPLDVGLRRIRQNLAAIPADRVIVLVWQGYRRQSGAPGDLGDQDTDKLAALQFWLPRLMRDDARIRGALTFAWHRVDGLATMPTLQGVQQAIANSLTPPPIETVGEEPQPTEPPRVTITDYQPREGTAPLVVTVTAVVSGGPATMLVVSAKRDPDGIHSEDDKPQPTTAHDLRLPWPGTYELTAHVTGPGGEGRTGATRIVIVNPKEEEPMPKIAFPPRNESRDFLEKRLESYYKDVLKRAPRDTFVDSEGVAVWMEGYLRRRVKGMSDQDAADDVIREIEGKPTTEPPDFR